MNDGQVTFTSCAIYDNEASYVSALPDTLVHGPHGLILILDSRSPCTFDLPSVGSTHHHSSKLGPWAPWTQPS